MKFTFTSVGIAMALGLAACGSSAGDGALSAADLAEACVNANDATEELTTAMGDIMGAALEGGGEPSENEMLEAMRPAMVHMLEAMYDSLYFLVEDDLVENPDEIQGALEELRPLVSDMRDASAEELRDMENLFEDLDAKIGDVEPDMKDDAALPDACEILETS